jgi:hypothetical protein
MGGIAHGAHHPPLCGVCLVLGSVYHIFTSLYRLYVKRERPRMVPTIKDLYDAINMVRYNLGLIDEHPKMPKFNFGEKLSIGPLSGARR